MKFFVAQTSITRFFFNCGKVKYLRHLLINHHTFFTESSLYILYLQIVSKRNSGESQEQHLGVVRQGTLKFKFNVRNHLNF